MSDEKEKQQNEVQEIKELKRIEKSYESDTSFNFEIGQRNKKFSLQFAPDDTAPPIVNISNTDDDKK